MTELSSLTDVSSRIIACQRCRRLRKYCETIAAEKRRAYQAWDYWGRPVPGFGDPKARLWIVGLAPGAHGANRTGRVFTGDRSGDFLFAALHRAGFANQPTSVSRDDGLALRDCYVSASVRCAPPGNKPLPAEVKNCSVYLDAEWDLLTRKQVILALGKLAWDAVLAMAGRNRTNVARASRPWRTDRGQSRGHGRDARATDRRVAFAHGATHPLADGLLLVGSYHVSQQNTFTGKLTEEMFDAVIRRCRQALC